MSDIIRLLPDNVANQIAAGEVVQRPASVVKELLENSIDAGSTSIMLIVKEGGRSLIQVVDDGWGMSDSDARMCFERHATSKIKLAEDLQSIRTNGFRGEALASIAAIAHVTLRTRREEDELGTAVIVEGTKVISQEPCACPKGSSISVKNLFFNVPARRQFLKSDAVEMKHVMDEFHRMALAHPEVNMELINNDHEIHKLRGTKQRQRIVHLLGKKYDQRLVPVGEDTDVVSIHGFVGKPEYAKKTRGEQFFFVNQRFIKSNYLNHAVSKAFDELISREHYPSFFLFLEVDPVTIDINIHPTKTEIKFRDERHIYAILNAAVRRALGMFNIAPTLDFNQENAIQLGGIDPARNYKVEQPKVVSNWRPQDVPGSSGKNWPSIFDKRREIVEYAPEEEVSDDVASDQQKIPFVQERADDHKSFQLQGQYMVAKMRSGFVVVDMQRARERVIYERALKQLESGSGASQQVLFPENIDLNPADFHLLSEYENELNALGLMFTHMGGNTIAVNGMPSEMRDASPEKLLEGILEQIKSESGQLKNERHEGMARVISQSYRDQRSNVTSESMHELIDQLFACEMPYYTASGKATLLTWGLDEIQERFG